jgi:hypothetical protein
MEADFLGMMPYITAVKSRLEAGKQAYHQRFLNCEVELV